MSIADYTRAVETIDREVKKITSRESDLPQELEVVAVAKNRRKKRVFSKFRMVVFGLLAVIYFILVGYPAKYEASRDLGLTTLSFNDARFTAKFLTKMLDWLFVPGPVAKEMIKNGQVTWVISADEIGNWLAGVGLAVLGWGSIICIPTFLVDDLIAKSTQRDEAAKEKANEEGKRVAEARAKGRLEVSHKSFNAIFTHTFDPVAIYIIKGLSATAGAKPWVMIQSGERYDTTENYADHVYLPDLAADYDYRELLHAQRLAENTVVILTNKPGYKFLGDPNNENEIDIPANQVVMFAENIRQYAKDVNLVVCGSTDAVTSSKTFRGHSRFKNATLGNISKRMGAELVDSDELVVKIMSQRAKGKPISIEFTGGQKQIESYQARFQVVIDRMKNKYPIAIASAKQEPTGGEFFYGEGAEGVALTRRNLKHREAKVNQTIIFENVDRIDEMEGLGFGTLCVDYEVAKEIARVVSRIG